MKNQKNLKRCVCLQVVLIYKTVVLLKQTATDLIHIFFLFFSSNLISNFDANNLG